MPPLRGEVATPKAVTEGWKLPLIIPTLPSPKGDSSPQGEPTIVNIFRADLGDSSLSLRMTGMQMMVFRVGNDPRVACVYRK